MPIRLNKSIKTRKLRLKKNLLMGLPKTKTSEEEAKQELTEVQRLFRDRRDAAKGQKSAVTDAGHYLILTFGDAARQRAFVEAAGIDPECHYFVDGDEIAEKMGINLPKRAKLVDAKRRPLANVPLIRDLPIAAR